MCRLMGLMANKPVTATFSLVNAVNSLETQVDSRNIQNFDNVDGWGIGYLDNNGSLVVDKEAKSARKSPFFRETAKTKSSRVFVSHIRYGDEPILKNTHPFERVVRGEKWIFAHNGKISKKKKLKGMLQDRATIQGSTDSELFFLLILKKYRKSGEMIEAIKRAIKMVRTRVRTYSSLNFLMTDGKKLYAYKENKSANNSRHELYCLTRDPEISRNHYNSSGLAVLFEEKASRGEKAVIIASEKMTPGENWLLFENRQLIVIDEKLQIQTINC